MYHITQPQPGHGLMLLLHTIPPLADQADRWARTLSKTEIMEVYD